MPKPAPGFLRRDVNPDVVLMICTAGHVDHGKTSLVKLLTGCNTDRLKIEQERGMTIELGFAPCSLGGNLCAGIVDVPGHEKFVHTMVAGVSGIDLTILVIASDDGIMPQTVEHFQIMELLGVRNGIVALTKIDLVPPERVREVTGQIREFLAGTFLDGAPICPVSSTTFEGYDEFYQVLVDRIRATDRKRRAGVFRMPIERAFTRPGFGFIVTGIPVDGTVRVGDDVELDPGGVTGKVRGIQRFLRDASEGSYGQCLALNIPDLAKSPPLRGQVISTPGYLNPARVLRVWMKSVPGLDRPLRHAEPIKFHTGTSEASGKVYFLEDKAFGGGEAVLASVALATPIAAAVHDRFIVRRPSPATTVAGGEILAVTETERRLRKEEIVEPLRAYRDCLAGMDPWSEEGLRRRVGFVLRVNRPKGATAKEIAVALVTPVDVVRRTIAELVRQGIVRALRAGPDSQPEGPLTPTPTETLARRTDNDYVADQDWFHVYVNALRDRIGKAVSAGAVSLSLAEFQGNDEWPDPLWEGLVDEVCKQGLGEMRGSRFVLRRDETQFSPLERETLSRLCRIYEETGFQSPRPDEVAGRLRLPQSQCDRLLEHLCNEGRLVRLSSHVILTREWLAKAQEMVVEAIRTNGVLDSGDFKHYIQSSRKYALAILDYLDSRRVTLRVGNLRKLAPDFQRNLL